MRIQRDDVNILGLISRQSQVAAVVWGRPSPPIGNDLKTYRYGDLGSGAVLQEAVEMREGEGGGGGEV